MRSIKEQVILITGSTDGIGKITARRLAEMGATVLVHGRNHEKCVTTTQAIREKTGSQKLGFYVSDFSSLSAVRGLAQEIQSDQRRLDVLINNAGVLPSKNSGNDRLLSQDGHELCFAVNFLAPFLLTHLLIPLLSRTSPSRIVNVSSAAQQRINFDDVMLERSYDPMQAYAQSKLALALFTFDIAPRLQEKDITANCLHPGSLLDTKMVRESFGAPQGSAESGAAVEVYVASSPDLEGKTGVYFEEKRESRAHEQAYDAQARQRLRRIAEKLTGIA